MVSPLLVHRIKFQISGLANLDGVSGEDFLSDKKKTRIYEHLCHLTLLVILLSFKENI